MVDIEINFYDSTFEKINVKETDYNKTLENIFGKVNKIIKEDISKFFFLFGGNKIDTHETFSQFIKKIDKEENIKIIAQKIEEENKMNKLYKSKQIICPSPECGKFLIFNIVNFSKIKFKKCEKNHEVKNDIFLKDYQENKFVDDSNIICDNCKQVKKSEAYRHCFYTCKSCKKNLCPICKNEHIKKEECKNNIIYLDQKNFYCEKHGAILTSYCETCQKSICSLTCQKEHKKHNISNLGAKTPNKEICYKNIEEINNFIESINKIITKLQKVIDNMKSIYNIYKDMLDNFSEEALNYEIYKNIGYLEKIEDNEVLKEAKSISQDEDDTIKQFSRIIDIYNKIEKSEKELKKQEVLKKQEALKKHKEELTKQYEELKGQHEELKKQKEELKKKEEDLEKQKEDLQKQKEDLEKQNEDLQEQEEDLQKQEEIRKKEEELRKAEEELQKNKEELQKKKEELQKQEEGLKKAEEIKKKLQELKKPEQELQRNLVELKNQEEELKQKEEELQKKQKEEE